MEPEFSKRENGGAPIVGWSKPSPSIYSGNKRGWTGVESPESEAKTVTEELSSPESEFNNNHQKEDELAVKFLVPPKAPGEDSLPSSLESICESEEQERPSRSKIPDGGWGWVIVFASFCNSAIADGISYSFGLLYIQLLDYFGASQAVTSWIGSLFLAVPLLSGPLCSALVDRFGCRWMTVLGATISCLGFVLSSFCDNIFAMYITFGIVAGLGLGLCYVTAVVSIAFWFDKKRSLANGMGACGTGIGTFLYAPFTQWLINEYGWRGSVLILGGTLFHMAVFGALMRDPDYIKESSQKPSVKSSRGGSSCGSIGCSDPNFPGTDQLKRMLQSGTLLPELANYLSKGSCLDSSEEIGSANFYSVVNLPTFIKAHEKVPDEVIYALKNNRQLYSVLLETYPSLLGVHLDCPEKVDESGGKHVTSPLLPSPPKSALVSPRSVRTSIKRDSTVKEANNYMKNLRVHRNSMMSRGAIAVNKYCIKSTSCPDIYRMSMTTKAKETDESWRTELMDLLNDISDFSMFLELHFLLVSVATTLVFTWFIIPYFYLAEHMTRLGYSQEEGSDMLSTIGVTNTIGMVAFGWAGDQPWVNVSYAYAISLLFTGLFTLIIPLVSYDYYLLLATSASFGLFFSACYSFTPPLLVELIPLDRFTTAYGLSLLCQGIGNLIGPPIAGMIFDLTQEWDWSFYVAGIGLIIAGFLIALVPLTKNRLLCGTGVLEKDKDSHA